MRKKKEKMLKVKCCVCGKSISRRARASKASKSRKYYCKNDIHFSIKKSSTKKKFPVVTNEPKLEKPISKSSSEVKDSKKEAIPTICGKCGHTSLEDRSDRYGLVLACIRCGWRFYGKFEDKLGKLAEESLEDPVENSAA
jgi:hypothetical protein